MLHTWIDGIPADVVPVDDRGLNYADGVFETLLCKQGRILGAQLHEARLALGLSRLAFPDADSLAEAVFATARQLLSGVGHSRYCQTHRNSGLWQKGLHTRFGCSHHAAFLSRKTIA